MTGSERRSYRNLGGLLVFSAGVFSLGTAHPSSFQTSRTSDPSFSFLLGLFGITNQRLVCFRIKTVLRLLCWLSLSLDDEVCILGSKSREVLLWKSFWIERDKYLLDWKPVLEKLLVLCRLQAPWKSINTFSGANLLGHAVLSSWGLSPLQLSLLMMSRSQVSRRHSSAYMVCYFLGWCSALLAFFPLNWSRSIYHFDSASMDLISDETQSFYSQVVFDHVVVANCFHFETCDRDGVVSCPSEWVASSSGHWSKYSD